MSKVFLGIHLVFATRHRKPTIPLDIRRDLYAYIHKILLNNNCRVFRINGISDHVHIAFDLSPTIPLSDMVRDLKRATSLFLLNNPAFPAFDGWGKGYFAETFSYTARNSVIEYIRNQEQHHLEKPLQDELNRLSLTSGLQFHPDDLQ